MMESLRVGMLFLPDPDCEKPIKVEDQSPIILTHLCAEHVCKALNQLRQFYDEQTSMEAWRKGRAQSEQLHTRVPILYVCRLRHRQGKALCPFPSSSQWYRLPTVLSL